MFLRQTRVRLTGAVSLVFVAVAAAAALGVWIVFAHLEYVNLDSALSSQSEALLGGLLEDNGRVSQGDALSSHDSVGGALLFDAQGHVLETAGAIPGEGIFRQTALTAAQTRRAVSQH